MHWVALDFFAQALSGDSAAQHVGARGSAREQSVDADEMKKRCADDDVAAAVVSGLALPPHYPAVSLATKLVSGACREELEPVVASRLKGAGNAFRSNACPLVAQKVSKARCAPVAEAPVPGPAPEPTAADQLAAAPRLRQAPPARNEAPSTPPAQRLEAVFPAIPAGQPVAAPADAIGELKGLDWKLLNLDPESAELLRGPNGEELMMARTKPGGQEFVLLKFKGIRSPWNERVVVVVERSRAAGKDYVTVLGNREAIVMIERQRQYQAFPKGVTGGLWFNPVRPSDQALKLPLRREIESEFATAAGVGD
jgi:hypothetical protein